MDAAGNLNTPLAVIGQYFTSWALYLLGMGMVRLLSIQVNGIDYFGSAGTRDVLCTIREQKHLLHHRSRCRYRYRPQSAAPVLVQGWICFPGRDPLLEVENTFLASKNRAAAGGHACCAFARRRTVDDG